MHYIAKRTAAASPLLEPNRLATSPTDKVPYLLGTGGVADSEDNRKPGPNRRCNRASTYRRCGGLLWEPLTHLRQFWRNSKHLGTSRELTGLKGLAVPQGGMPSDQQVSNVACNGFLDRGSGLRIPLGLPSFPA